MMRWNSTKTYTQDDILRMQQEAVNRVHEFQERAQSVSTFYDMPTIGEYHPQPLEHTLPPIIEAQSRLVDTPIPPPNPMNPADPILGLLDKFNIDSETLLILGLIFLLYNEKADNTLLLALGYLLL